MNTKHDDKGRAIVVSAIKKIAEMNPQSTDGKWLEDVTVESAPYIMDWDIEQCWHWNEWPDRKSCFPQTTKQDIGIDIVARRRSDKQFVAIQCKSRKLYGEGRGSPINKREVEAFAAISAVRLWAERWIVTNGNIPLTKTAEQLVSTQDKPIISVNVANDLMQQRASHTPEYGVAERCLHCVSSDNEEAIQTRSCMQREAVAKSVRILKEQKRSESGGLPVGEARGRIILPCATGKTRISLRVVEELTSPGEVSVVLCPSIALVAQIRREYLQNAAVPMDVLAVCSDKTAGYDPKKEGSRNTASDPTVDNSNVSASEVKGRVTTDAGEIADWMRAGTPNGGIKVLIGTYQSSLRVSEALLDAEITARVLIADEAHRTAGLKRKKSASAKATAEAKRIRDFTVCHDNKRFPVIYRVYQTATPRIYSATAPARNPDWIVRSMDDETTFGVELFRKSYMEAVRNGWLSDYRIIALGINDREAFEAANILAKNTKSTGRRKLTTTDYLRGLAFALTMGGATQGRDVNIKSCIAFMNTVDKSKNMAADLQTETVKNWVSRWLDENSDGREVSDYSLEHLDATSNAAARETAKLRLASADAEKPHGIINVGIFGEVTDSPSLSAVAFLEERKSPIDVVQAVGRAMRTAPGKELGYIVCPILIPPSADPETWLSNSGPDDGWKELGQILLALRAHDQRIEENLEDLLSLYIPKPPPVERSIVAVARLGSGRIQYGEHEGPPGAAAKAVSEMLNGKTRAEAGANRIGATRTPPYKADETTRLYTGKKSTDGTTDIRTATVARDKPKAGAARGAVNISKTKAKAREMINTGKGGTPVEPTKPRKTGQTAADKAEKSAQIMLKLSDLKEHGSAIKMNLLTKSGLSDNRVIRDLNILESSVSEAAHHLLSDELSPALNRHFGLDRLSSVALKKQADGCTIAALLMMNAAMLHHRIANVTSIAAVRGLETVKYDVNALLRIRRDRELIMRHDFRPVLEPAVGAVEAVEDTGKLAGLERALRHLEERAGSQFEPRVVDALGDLVRRTG